MGYHQSADQRINKVDIMDSLQFQGLHLGKRTFTEQLSAATLTVDVEDSGKVFLVSVTSVITLPAVGAEFGPFTFVNYGVETSQVSDVQISISPNSSDLIYGPDITAATNKDIVNTLATARRGDLIRIEYASGSGWRIADLVGTWARES